jgi:hypothetical protein
MSTTRYGQEFLMLTRRNRGAARVIAAGRAVNNDWPYRA